MVFLFQTQSHLFVFVIASFHTVMGCNGLVVWCVFLSADDSLLRQDDIWMLDGDEPQEPTCRAQRPDHLDFLRITPPEDDIIGDTPYCPKLERMVRESHKTHEKVCFCKTLPSL